MSYRKHGVRIESCFKETALKDVGGAWAQLELTDALMKDHQERL